MNYYTVTIDGKPYTFAASGDKLIIQDDTKRPGEPCKKAIKVEDCHEYIYKVMKTKIKAQGGARGLYDFMVKAFTENFMNCMASAVLRAAINDVREARA